MQITLKYHLAALIFDIIADQKFSLGIYEANKIEIFKNELYRLLL